MPSVSAGSMPTRRDITAALRPFVGPANGPGLLAVVLDALLFVLFVGGSVVAEPLVLRVVFSMLAGIWIARLFILGHDACHQSLFASPRVNEVLGRLAFLPSLTPYSLWAVGHNIAHHGFNNLRGRDYVWVPFSPEEFRELPRWRRALERIYRSGFGCGLYYLLELWWKKLYFPNRNHVGARRSTFVLDGLLVSAFLAVWVTFLLWLAALEGRSTLEAMVFGLIVPFALWNCLMGFVIYAHHTAPDMDWFDSKQEWSQSRVNLTGTISMYIPVLGKLLHNIFDHPAHHVDTRIPFRRLPDAQRALEQAFPQLFTQRSFSFRGYLETVRTCKLFDYQSKQWCDFSASGVGT